MGRPRTVKAELVTKDPPQKQKTVNARHKIEYEAPVFVPDDGAEDPELTIEEQDDPQEMERRQRRKTAKDERDELRRDMEKIGVAPANRLKLTIEKYKHSDSLDSGVSADKDYCTKYGITRENILNDDFLEVARRYGAGRYWFTLRLDNKIVRQWEREITLPGSGATMIQQNPNDPTSPQVIVNVPENGAPGIPLDPFKEAERALSLVKKYNEAFGAFQPQGSASNGRTDEEILAGAILKTPDMVENVVGGLVKRFGRNGNPDDDPSPWAVAMRAIETGQAAQIVNSLVNGFFNGLRGMIPQNGGQQHGQAQMGTPPFQNQGAPIQNQNVQPPANLHEIQNPQTQPQSAPDMGEAGAPASPDQQQQMSPENQALSLIITQCQRKAPPRLVFSQLMDMEGRYTTLLDQHAMQTGQILPNPITANLGLFAYTPIESVMNFVRSLPGGASVVDLPHAKEWTEQLQQLIKQDIEREEEPEKS